MRLLVLFVCFLVVTFSYPVDESDDEVAPDGLTALDDNLLFDWSLGNDKLMMLQIDIDVQFTWLLLGFETVPYQDVASQQLLFVSVNLEKMTIRLKTVEHRDETFRLLPNEERLYDWEAKQIDREKQLFKFKISRYTNDLPIAVPLALIYAYGESKDINEEGDLLTINPKRFNYATVTLSDHTSLLKLDHQPTEDDVTTTPLTATTPLTTTSPLTTTTPLTTTRIKTTQTTEKATSPNVQASVEVKKSSKEDETDHSINQEYKHSTQKPVKIVKVIKTTASTNTPTTSCPPQIKCNCTNQVKTKTPWYDVLNAKDNSIYFSIIGAAALLTGLVVLCVACCCARSSKTIPRTRTHKVAFYKVDDLASETDEEVEFLKEDKD